MELNSFSQMLTVTIEAFAAILGISIALYIYLHQRYSLFRDEFRTRIQTNLRHIIQVFEQLDQEFLTKHPSFEDRAFARWGAHVEFRREIEKIAREYHDLLDQEVEVDVARVKQVARREIALMSREVEKDMRIMEYVVRGPNFPRMFFILLLVICAFPIFYSLYNLLLITYSLPIAEWSGYALFVIDIVSLFLFGLVSVKLYRP